MGNDMRKSFKMENGKYFCAFEFASIVNAIDGRFKAQNSQALLTYLTKYENQLDGHVVIQRGQIHEGDPRMDG